MSKHLEKIIINALEDVKATDISIIDVQSLTDVTDTIIIATGNSHRQVKALAANVLIDTKTEKFIPIGIEGENAREWILIDFGHVVTNIMLPATREFYDLDRLWTLRPESTKSQIETLIRDEMERS